MSVNFDKVTFGGDFEFSPTCSYHELAFCLVKTDPDGSKHYFGHCFFQSFADIIRDLMLYSRLVIAENSYIHENCDTIDIYLLGMFTCDNVWHTPSHEFSFPLKRVFDYAIPDPDPNVIDFLEREGFLDSSIFSVDRSEGSLIPSFPTGVGSGPSIEDGN